MLLFIQHVFLAGKKNMFVFFLLVLTSVVKCLLVGVDLGDSYFKVSLLTPGQPVQILLNSHSKRKTYTAINFKGPSRVYGDDAIARLTKDPKQIISMPFQLLRGLDSVGVDEEFWQELYPDINSNFFFPSTKLDETNQRIFILDKEKEFTTKQILAMFFRHIKSEALKSGLEKEAAGKQLRLDRKNVDAVIGIPPWFNFKQKRVLLDAANIAGLNVLQISNSVGAAAVLHGSDLQADWKKNNTTDPSEDLSSVKNGIKELSKIILDVGSFDTSVCIVEYSQNITSKEAILSVSVPKCKYFNGFGGGIPAYTLAEHLLQKFLASNPDAPLTQRSYAKFLSAADKAKTQLSTSKEAKISIEMVSGERNLKTDVTREEFENTFSSYLPQIGKICEELIEDFGKPLNIIKEVETIGGGWRIPSVLRYIEEFFSTKSIPVRQHLNGDEAASFGLSWLGANASSAYRIVPMTYHETLPQKYSVSFLSLEGDGKISGDDKMEIFPHHSQLGHVQRIVLNQVESDFSVNLFEDNTKQPVDSYNVTGLSKAKEDDEFMHLDQPDVRLLFVLETKSGLPKLAKGLAVYQVPPLIENEDSTEHPPSTTSDSTTGLADSVSSVEATNHSTTKEVRETEKKLPLVIKNLSRMSEGIKSENIATLYVIEKAEEELRQKAEARNKLESYAYECRDKVKYNEDFISMGKKIEIQNLADKAAKVLEWFSENSFSASLDDLEGQMHDLQKLHEVMGMRFQFKKDFGHLESTIIEFMTKIEKSMLEIEELSYIPEEVLSIARSAVIDFRSWANENIEAYKSQDLFEDPIFTRAEVEQKMSNCLSLITKARRHPKPTTTTTTTTTTKTTVEPLDTNKFTEGNEAEEVELAEERKEKNSTKDQSEKSSQFDFDAEKAQDL
eukprot:GHVP01041546.1.p1 GENE.GHVP01041546.1~~GHVP01041546.1.p1  ORF type:complete len:899 (+),score=215.61 GHVP01041546.1:4438-7134(+)